MLRKYAVASPASDQAHMRHALTGPLESSLDHLVVPSIVSSFIFFIFFLFFIFHSSIFLSMRRASHYSSFFLCAFCLSLAGWGKTRYRRECAPFNVVVVHRVSHIRTRTQYFEPNEAGSCSLISRAAAVDHHHQISMLPAIPLTHVHIRTP